MKKIILASGSPRRKTLFEWAELPFEIVVSDADESFNQSDSPSDIALSIACKKNIAARAIMNNEQASSIVVSADTIVVLDNKVIGKPQDRDDAICILQQLSGKTHRVITAVCISDHQKEYTFFDTTHVTFHELTDEQITHYVDHYKPFDKAGAYAIQEWIGVVGIRAIEGDFYNVMGLPISRVVTTLKTEFFTG
ncbi:MAG: Maf family protein [bacterium]|jgi:septum formation protein